MVMDLTSGSLAVNGDLSTATGWSNATVRLHNSAHIYFNASQTLNALSVQGSATVTARKAPPEVPPICCNWIRFRLRPPPRWTWATMR